MSNQIKEEQIKVLVKKAESAGAKSKKEKQGKLENNL